MTNRDKEKSLEEILYEQNIDIDHLQYIGGCGEAGVRRGLRSSSQDCRTLQEGCFMASP